MQIFEQNLSQDISGERFQFSIKGPKDWVKRQTNLDGSDSEELNEAAEHSEDVDQGDVDDDDAGRGAPYPRSALAHWYHLPHAPTSALEEECTCQRITVQLKSRRKVYASVCTR